MRLTYLLFLLSSLTVSFCASHYYLGDQGLSCNEVCFKQKKNCHPKIDTNNNYNLFTTLGVTCKPSTAAWNSQAQPAYVSDPKSKDFGKCMGYVDAPAAGHCFASDPSVQRLCRCDDPEDAASTFGTGFSAGYITTKEQWIFQHFVKDGDVGVLNHFWATYLGVKDEGTIIRYYIDGETTASIQFTPSLACGVGFYNQAGPWGTEWFGKGAKNGAWYNNFKIPFQKSIVVTVQHTIEAHDAFYMILRGSVNLPIVLGGMTLPKTARMNQKQLKGTHQALEFVSFVDVPSGPGAHFMVTMAAESETISYLEGCIHAYFDGNTEFPGTVLATGTEDYFDSAWYFDGGPFHFPSSGVTYFDESLSSVKFSAYRFHDKHPLFFKNGFRLDWRVGDRDDVTGMKCYVIDGGKIHEHPKSVRLDGYAWYYTWPAA